MYKQIVKRYLNYLHEQGYIKVDASWSQELLRCALCISLGLRVVINEIGIYEQAVRCAADITKGYDFSEMSESERQALLEACVHTMRMVVKKGRVKVNG